ncbi:MAG: UDP-N-acetylenolpyruvoylglucosamine reductase [Rickettsiales bacterium]|nr:UDP-N-acetylenolpyruvoylglucosamine reductase [Rickettsiales bacterium]
MLIYHFFKDLIDIKINYDIGKKTWFGTGGKSKVLLIINNLKSLKFLLKILPRSKSIFLIGAGSNIIIRDGGLDGITIKLGKDFKKIGYKKKKKIINIGSAVKDLDISKFCLENSIGNFEFLRGIPGTLGGNIRMNAGCFGYSISDKLLSCKIIDRNGNVEEFHKENLKFDYRFSSIPMDSIVIDAKFKAITKDKKIIRKMLKKITDERILNQPVNFRTGGSTFKNTPKESAWKLIDKTNFRGKVIGGAKVSDLHTNFLINNGNANSLDLELLGEEIRSKVKKKYNVNLDWELMRVGKFKKI